MTDDNAAAYTTLWTVLVTLAKLSAPYTPFIAETMYRNLVPQFFKDAPVSVHLCRFPECDDSMVDKDLEESMKDVMSIVVLGRAARNDKGRVVMYADTITQSMQRAYDETMRRRKIQDEYNKAHGIVPKTVVSAIKNSLEITKKAVNTEKLSVKDMIKEIERLKGLMQVAAERLDFEKAIAIRDEMNDLKKQIKKLS